MGTTGIAIGSLGAELGISGVEAGAAENASVQNSGVFSAIQNYNTTGFKYSNPSTSNNTLIILIFIIIISVVVYLIYTR